MSHSRQTEHYGLPLYNGTDIINPLTDFNDANEAIDEAIYNANQRSVEAEESAQHSAETVTQYDARVTEAETIATNAGIKADNTQKMIAEDFDPLKEDGYKIGDSVIYNQHLYTFINPHSGAWDASDVKEQPISDALEDTIEQAKTDIQNELDDAIAQIDSQMVRVPATQAMIAPAFDPDKEDGYDAGEVVTFADKLYKFNEHHEGDWNGVDVEKVDVITITNNIADYAKSVNTKVDATDAKVDATDAKVDATDAKVDVIESKVDAKVMLSEEKFYSHTTTATWANKIKAVIEHVIEEFNNKTEDVIDIVVDGIDIDGMTFVCEWSLFDIVIGRKKVNSSYINLDSDGSSYVSFNNRYLDYWGSTGVTEYFQQLVNTPYGTSGNATGVGTNIGTVSSNSPVQIAYHYLYKL